MAKNGKMVQTLDANLQYQKSINDAAADKAAVLKAKKLADIERYTR